MRKFIPTKEEGLYVNCGLRNIEVKRKVPVPGAGSSQQRASLLSTISFPASASRSIQLERPVQEVQRTKQPFSSQVSKRTTKLPSSKQWNRTANKTSCLDLVLPNIVEKMPVLQTPIAGTSRSKKKIEFQREKIISNMRAMQVSPAQYKSKNLSRSKSISVRNLVVPDSRSLSVAHLAPALLPKVLVSSTRCNPSTSDSRALRLSYSRKLRNRCLTNVNQSKSVAIHQKSRALENSKKNVPRKILSRRCSNGKKSTPSRVPPKSMTQSKPLNPRITKPVQNPMQKNKSHQFERINDFTPTRLIVGDDTLTLELQKDTQAIQLSYEFMCKNVSAEQRNLAMAMLIGLGARCRYHSSIIYQAGKIFDVATSRFQVEEKHILLIALAALWIALNQTKIISQKIPSTTELLNIAESKYIQKEDENENESNEELLIKYERIIMTNLNNKLIFVDPFTLFIHHVKNCQLHYIISNNAMKFIYYCGGYLIDLSLLDERISWNSTILIAYTIAELALGLGIDAIQDNGKPRWTLWQILMTHSSPCLKNFKNDEITKIRGQLLRDVLSSKKRNSNFKVVYEKYSTNARQMSDLLFSRVNWISKKWT